MARDLVDILMDKGAVQMILGYGWTIWEVWAANSWNGRTPGRQWWFHGERYNHVRCPGMCSSFRVLKMILLVNFGRSVHDCGRVYFGSTTPPSRKRQTSTFVSGNFQVEH